MSERTVYDSNYVTKLFKIFGKNIFWLCQLSNFEMYFLNIVATGETVVILLSRFKLYSKMLVVTS